MSGNHLKKITDNKNKDQNAKKKKNKKTTCIEMYNDHADTNT